MTLAVAVVTSDGVVIAADSRTTSWGNPPRVLSDFTHKVFKVGNVAVATYGYAFVLGRNIAGHMGELAKEMADDNLGPEQLAERMCSVFRERLEQHYAQGVDTRPPADSTALGFLVGGFEDGNGVLYECLLPRGATVKIASTTSGGGAAWRGMSDVVVRLVKGVDFDCLYGQASDEQKPHVEALEELFPKIEYAIPFGAMGLQDAIDFTVLAIRTTIDVQRLTNGSIGRLGSWPGVGGPIEIAAVTSIEGFRWVQRTALQGERAAGAAELAQPR